MSESSDTVAGRASLEGLSLATIIPSRNRTGEVINRIETIIEEGFADPLLQDPPQPLSLPFCRRTATGDFKRTTVLFPGEARKYSQILRLLQKSHTALREGKVLTKRNLYYEDPELYGSQARVNELVDGLVWTLGVQRHDLGIVAAGKGLVAGPVRVHLHSPSSEVLDFSQNTEGVIIPPHVSIRHIDFGSVCWVLVIEKEATFRTLAASKFWESAMAGPCMLVTGKGYPDLKTTQFLHLVHEYQRTMPMYALVDFDPDGINIYRCYKWDSRPTTERGDKTSLPRLRWLGIKSNDIILPHPNAQGGQYSQVPESQGSISSQTSVTSTSSSISYHGLMVLSDRDRKRAVKLLAVFMGEDTDNPDVMEVIHELQVLLMLNLKGEMQILNDNGGDIRGYLDGKLGSDFC